MFRFFFGVGSRRLGVPDAENLKSPRGFAACCSLYNGTVAVCLYIPT